MQRILCLSAEAADICARLGAWDRVVAVSAFASQAGLERRPVIGGFSSCDIERALSFSPDLVIAFSDVQAGIAAEFIRAGCTVLATNQRTLVEIEETIRLIGRTIGLPEKGAKLARDFRAGLDSVACHEGPHPKVYFEEWPDPAVSGIGWVGEIIELAGGVDIFAERRGGKAAARTVVWEEILRAEPDIILASWCGKPVDVSSIAKRPGFEALQAVKDGHIYALDSDIILQPGPRLIEGAREVRRILDRWRHEIAGAVT